MPFGHDFPISSWPSHAGLLPDELDEVQVLLSEPLVVLADDPRTCSEFVSAAVDLIRPVKLRRINIRWYKFTDLIQRYHLGAIAGRI